MNLVLVGLCFRVHSARESARYELTLVTVGEIVNYLAEEGYQVLSDLRKHQAQFDKHGLLGRDP